MSNKKNIIFEGLKYSVETTKTFSNEKIFSIKFTCMLVLLGQ